MAAQTAAMAAGGEGDAAAATAAEAPIRFANAAGRLSNIPPPVFVPTPAAEVEEEEEEVPSAVGQFLHMHALQAHCLQCMVLYASACFAHLCLCFASVCFVFVSSASPMVLPVRPPHKTYIDIQNFRLSLAATLAAGEQVNWMKDVFPKLTANDGSDIATRAGKWAFLTPAWINEQKALAADEWAEHEQAEEVYNSQTTTMKAVGAETIAAAAAKTREAKKQTKSTMCSTVMALGAPIMNRNVPLLPSDEGIDYVSTKQHHPLHALCLHCMILA